MAPCRRLPGALIPLCALLRCVAPNTVISNSQLQACVQDGTVRSTRGRQLRCAARALCTGTAARLPLGALTGRARAAAGRGADLQAEARRDRGRD